MSSERQINANRINGAKSRGSITPEGRLASSRNSLVHGLLSEAIILEGESGERFNALHDSLIAEFIPVRSSVLPLGSKRRSTTWSASLTSQGSRASRN
jgi:hypothetical protein